MAELEPVPPAGDEPARGRVRRMGRAISSFPGAGLVFAPPKTAAFVLDTWLRGRRPSAGETGDMPAPRLSLALAAQVALDEAVLSVVKNPRLYPAESDYAGIVSELNAALELYRDRGWLDDPTAYHRAPLSLSDPTVSRAWAAGVAHERLAWPSEYEPYPDEPGRERWSSYRANHTAHARVLSAEAPDRPWLVCIHGFGTGWPMADFFAFRARHLSHDLGLNLLMPVLPLHGPRKVGRLGGREMLSSQLQDFVLGMAQAIWDIRRLIQWARENRGATRIGVYGMSLGAYVASLLATVEPGLDLVIAGAPLCDIPQLYLAHTPARLRQQATQFGLTEDAGSQVQRVVSPLAAPPLVDRGRLFLFAGVGDRMSTPAQARLLWEHWGRPRMAWYPGSHTSFVWSADVARFLHASLLRTGFIDRRAVRAAQSEEGSVNGRRPTPGSTA